MKYVFDIDETICTKTQDGTYTDCEPIQRRIDVINKLYNDGHRIYLNTARGMGRTNDNPAVARHIFEGLTKSSLATWGVKYHKLFMGKPSGDFYIDDKAIRDGEFFDDNES